MTLTCRQYQTLSAIRRHERRHGVMPTLGELARTMGIGKQSMLDLLEGMEQRGAIVRCLDLSGRRRRRYAPRGIVIIAKPSIWDRLRWPIMGEIRGGQIVEVAR